MTCCCGEDGRPGAPRRSAAPPSKSAEGPAMRCPFRYLVVMGVLVEVCSGAASFGQAAKPDEIIAKIEKAGGKVDYDNVEGAKAIRNIDVHNTPFGDGDMRMLKGLTT